MNKNNENQKPTTETKTDEAVETIETVSLDDVTGGCATCGRHNLGQAAQQPQTYRY